MNNSARKKILINVDEVGFLTDELKTSQFVGLEGEARWLQRSEALQLRVADAG